MVIKIKENVSDLGLTRSCQTFLSGEFIPIGLSKYLAVHPWKMI